MFPTYLSVNTVHLSSTNAVQAPSQPVVNLESVTTLMPEPQGADISLAIAQMVIENAFTSRKQARESRQHANAAMVSAQEDQIAHLRAEADKRYEAAKLEAWGKIGEGALGIAGGVIQAGAFGAANDGSARRCTGIGTSFDSGGKVASGTLGLVAADRRHDADLLSASAKADEMEATAQKRIIEDADDDVKDAREHVRTALDFLREFQSTESKAMSSAIKA